MYAEDRAKKNCIYNFFFEIIISVSFNFLIYLVIIGSVISLAMFSFKKTEEEKELLDILDMVFGIFFLIEMICKLIGLGVKNYLRDRYNVFDAFIVIVGLVDIALLLSFKDDDSISQLDGLMSSMRALRLLRVFKLAK